MRKESWSSPKPQHLSGGRGKGKRLHDVSDPEPCDGDGGQDDLSAELLTVTMHLLLGRVTCSSHAPISCLGYLQ